MAAGRSDGDSQGKKAMLITPLSRVQWVRRWQIYVSISDISMQIPSFACDRDNDVANWIKRVDIIHNNNGLSDATAALLATNKLDKGTKDW